MRNDDRGSPSIVLAAGQARFRHVLLALIVASLLWHPPLARAAGDPVRGQSLFNVTYACNACHDKGVIPAPNIFDISSGRSANGILFAIQSTGQMARYSTTLATNPVDLADIAAYIGLGYDSPNRDQHGFTGSWFEAATSGQGVEVEVYPGPTRASVFVSWFTYDASTGGADHQRWYTALGSTQTGEPIVPLTLYLNTGGSFDAPPITSSQSVGTATLYFDTCTSGSFSYSFSDGTGRTGTIPLTRLTQSVTCSFVSPYPTDVDFALSGNWYEAATSGQGFTVEVNARSGAFFLTWYTYSPGGTSLGVTGQRWYTAQGSFAAGMRTVPVTIYQTTGGVFDAPTPPGQSTVVVGTGTMTYHSCTDATFSYTFTGGSSSGQSRSIPLIRVGPVPPGCTS